MKKFIMMALVALAVCGMSFAKTYVIDIADSANGTSLPLQKDQYSTDHKVIPPIDVTKYFAGTKFAAGDEIEIYYNFVADKDIPNLIVMVIDNHEKAKWWSEIAGDYVQGISGIKKGVPCKGYIKLKVVKPQLYNVTVQLINKENVTCNIKASPAGVKTGSVK